MNRTKRTPSDAPLTWLAGCVLLGVACAPPAPASAPGRVEPTPAEPLAAVVPFGAGDRAAEGCLAEPSDCRLGARSCAERCRDHERDACHRFAEGADDDCKRVLWALACAENHAASCADLGRALLELDPPRAHELLATACHGGHARACTVLGLELAALDRRSEAVRLLERGCAQGEGEGCTEAGRHHNHGAGVDRDQARGAELLERGCGLGYAPGCLDLAGAHLRGEGVPHDADRALELVEAVCDLPETDTGGAGCYLLGQLLQQGHTAPPMGDARRAFERACDKGSFDGCMMTAFLLFDDGRYEESAELAERLVDEEPDHYRVRETRALSRLMLGRFADAAADFEVLGEMRPDWPYAPLLLWVTRTRAGLEAADDLEIARARMAPGWPAPVADFLLGRLSEEALFRAAIHPVDRTQREQQCEAFYYAAQRHQAAGRKAVARRLFERTVATGVVDFIEYVGARAELAR
jgi:tetratricopeptide (TPR) repeat protein